MMGMEKVYRSIRNEVIFRIYVRVKVTINCHLESCGFALSQAFESVACVYRTR